MAMDVSPSYRLQVLTVAYPVSVRVIHSSYSRHSVLNHSKSKSPTVWIYKICFAAEALTVKAEKNPKRYISIQKPSEPLL